MKPDRTQSWALSLVVAIGVFSGCAQNISLENYNRLRVGQSYDEVKQIIGEPARCDEMLGVRTCAWGTEQRGITIGFLGGKALLLSAQNLQ